MRMIKITMLGTSGSLPTVNRHMPAVALVHEGDTFLFDCGEGTQSQMLRYGVNMFKVRAIFLSHAHGDHIIGVAGLVRTLALQGRKEPLLIFIPAGEEKVIKNLVVFDRAIINYPIIIKGIKTGVAYEGKDFKISAFRLKHTVPALGFIFKENDMRRFIIEKAKALGLKGKMFSELQKKGRIKVGGRTVTLSSITTEQVGKKIAYATDTRPVKETATAAKGADVLIHEAAYSDKEGKLAKERGHSTAREAAEVAKKAKAKLLIITHISARHKTATELVKEAKEVFGNVSAPNDGFTIEV